MSVIGIDIGGTKTAAGIVDANGAVAARTTVPTPSTRGGRAVVDLVLRLVDDLARQDPSVTGIGIGTAGVVDPRTGGIASATDAIRDWAGTPLRSEVADATGLPTTALNDVHAHAVAEARVGAGVGARRVLLVALGTGIGGALVVGGTVDPGRTGAAGHVGHLVSPAAAGRRCTCGGSGHLEAIASGPAILETHRGAAAVAVDHTRDVFGLAAAGDDVAQRIVEGAGTAVGEAIGGLVNVLDPDVVVLGGGLAYADRAWSDLIERTAHATMIPVVRDCPVVLSTLAGDAAVIGAALHHLDRRNTVTGGTP